MGYPAPELPGGFPEASVAVTELNFFFTMLSSL
jgi:hypothetical protein